MKRIIFINFIWLLSVAQALGQTVLFAEDFENRTLGGLTTVNDQPSTVWYAGPAPSNGPRLAGNSAAFISNSATTYGPLPGVDGVTHLYRDITFPADETEFRLLFDARSEGQLDVFLAPSSYQPMAGTEPPLLSFLTRIGQFSTYSSFSIPLNANVAGTTQRLIFTWVSRNGGGVPPAVLDNVQVLAGPVPPLNGTYTINRALPATSRNYQSFQEAIWRLNTGGVIGPVTLNVAAGQRFTEVPPALLRDNPYPVIFRKDGIGSNPEIMAGNTAAAIELRGASYITLRWSRLGAQKQDVYFCCHDRKKEQVHAG